MVGCALHGDGVAGHTCGNARQETIARMNPIRALKGRVDICIWRTRYTKPGSDGAGACISSRTLRDFSAFFAVRAFTAKCTKEREARKVRLAIGAFQFSVTLGADGARGALGGVGNSDSSLPEDALRISIVP